MNIRILSIVITTFAVISGHVMAAHVGTITDTTPGSATNDGTINSGEYVGSTTGINSGFGDVIGATSTLSLDSSSTGQLNIALKPGAGNLNDVVVIYIDSIAGGVSGTAALNDTSDPGKAAISGNGTGGGASEITFAPGASVGAVFRADFAITIEQAFSGLYSIATGAVTFVRSNNLNPTTGPDSNLGREIQLSLSDIGLAPGGSFNYFATYLNASNAFRSNEFQGVRNQSPAFDGNVGQNPVTLADGDYLTFQSVPEPSTLTLALVSAIGLIARRRRSR